MTQFEVREIREACFSVDAACAQVMGWKRDSNGYGWVTEEHFDEESGITSHMMRTQFYPSLEIEHAWLLVEWMRDVKREHLLIPFSTEIRELTGTITDFELWLTLEPLTICKAFLLANEVNQIDDLQK